MRAESWQRWMAVTVTVLALAAAVARAQEADEPEKVEPGKVILSWETFRELTSAERQPAAEPKLVLPWQEVQDILGVKVEDADLEGAELTLDWRQFRALLEWSIAQKEPEKVEDLPADFIIASADMSGTLQEEGATFELNMTVNILKEKGWKRVPLLPATVALKEAVLPAGCYLNVAGGSYEMLTTEKGPKDVRLVFAAAVTEQAGAYKVGFGMVPTGTSVLKLTVPRKDVDIKVAGAQAVLPLQGGVDETVVGASLPSGAPVAITWERALVVVEKVPSKLYAETRTLVMVGEGIMTCRERVELSVLHSGIRSVKLEVPDGVSVLDVTGTAVHDWNVANGALEVRFAHEVIGANSLDLVYELAAAADAEGAGAQAPVLSVEGAIREKGYVGVVVQANVEISAGSGTTATVIDVRELPADILSMTTQPVLLAFRYVGSGPSIPLLVQKHEDVKVLVTIVDTASIIAMQTIDGPRITKVLYSVRNNRNQFLRLSMPAGADIWSVSVAGKSVRPASDDEGRVLIPLVRSSGARRALSAFPVELTYVQTPLAKVGKSGNMQVDLPTTDQPVTQVMVQLFLPAEGSYKTGMFGGLSFEGPLHLVEQFTALATTAAAGAPRVDAAVQVADLQREAVQRAEQQERETGVEPIRVRLPIRGKVFRFEKILSIDEKLWVKFRYSGWEHE